ncbi:MAG: hypothetical protein II949_03890 [Prevotella sp.]|nr:hypothetical protein [Prevotella sp.]
MKQIKTMLLVGLTVLLMASCATKERALDRLENFSVELQYHSQEYDLNDWEHAAKKFIKIRKDISKHEMEYTSEQKRRIGELEGECASYMVKGAKDKVVGIGSEIGGILQGIFDSIMK